MVAVIKFAGYVEKGARKTSLSPFAAVRFLFRERLLCAPQATTGTLAGMGWFGRTFRRVYCMPRRRSKLAPLPTFPKQSTNLT